MYTIHKGCSVTRWSVIRYLWRLRQTQCKFHSSMRSEYPFISSATIRYCCDFRLSIRHRRSLSGWGYFLIVCLPICKRNILLTWIYTDIEENCRPNNLVTETNILFWFFAFLFISSSDASLFIRRIETCRGTKRPSALVMVTVWSMLYWDQVCLTSKEIDWQMWINITNTSIRQQQYEFHRCLKRIN